MSALEPWLHSIAALTPFSIAVVALAGLVVGIAPSSFPLLSVAAGLAAGRGVAGAEASRLEGLRLSLGFVLGIATVDAALGALFGLVGFAVLRVLVSYLALVYTLLGVALVTAALALLRIVHLRLPVLSPSPHATRGFFGSYLLGLPFGLSTCPACTPLLLPVVTAATSTADPLLGAVLMLTFGLARGAPIVVAGTAAGAAVRMRHSYPFTRWVERIAGALTLAAAAYFLYQALIYAGWLAP